MANILIVDDEEKICKLLQEELVEAGHKARGLTSPATALEQIRADAPDILLSDLRMSEMDGIALLEKTKELAPTTDVVIMTAYASVETALETMRRGAYDYIIKPFSTQELLMLIDRIEEKRTLEAEKGELHSYIRGDTDRIVGSSQAISKVKKLIRDLAGSEAPVLIRGESGTGKELVAKAIHETSTRKEGPFIAINCAAIPESLLESELFGYERGAFTGANRKKLGHFQLAARGSLFLDEIGDLPLSLQSKLLRVIESHRVTPLGGERETAVDIRLITATHRPLEDDIRSGRFREDLYYRVNVFPIELTPLRERREDIAELARHLMSRSGRSAGDLSNEALRKLQGYGWPGNIRELRNVIERAMIVRRDGPIGADDIILGNMASPAEEGGASRTLNLGELEKQVITKALKLTGGNKSEAARLLGITRRALYGRLQRYDLLDD